MRFKKHITRSSSKGFTLIELAIAITTASAILIAALKMIKSWTDQSAIITSQQRLVTIQQALTNYESQYGVLPCPATYTGAPNTPAFGRAISPCTAAPPAGVFAAPGRKGTTDPYGLLNNPTPTGSLLMGALPVRDLGLPDSYISNGSGYRYTYAVTLSETTAFNPYAGTISIEDGGGHNVLPLAPDGTTQTALYVVVDHGKDGKGAYTTAGVASPIACTSKPGLDVDNCNHYATKTFRNAQYSTNTGATWFDDMIIYGSSTSSAPACTRVFGSSANGGTASHSQTGSDSGIGSGFNATMVIGFEVFSLNQIYNWLYIDTTALASTNAMIADAYCPDPSYHVVTGGCTYTANTAKVSTGAVANGYNGPVSNIDGLDVYPGPFPSYQYLLPALSHPIPSNTLGIQGWECDGTSANGIYTQAYAVCCPK